MARMTWIQWRYHGDEVAALECGCGCTSGVGVHPGSHCSFLWDGIRKTCARTITLVAGHVKLHKE